MGIVDRVQFDARLEAFVRAHHVPFHNVTVVLAEMPVKIKLLLRSHCLRVVCCIL